MQTQQTKKARTLTNNVLIEQSKFEKKHQSYTLYLPGYLRFAFKKIAQINLEQAEVDVSGTFVLTIYYFGLGPEAVYEIKRGLQVCLNDQFIFSLSPDDRDQSKKGSVHFSDNEQKGELTIQWRHRFTMEMASNIWLSPFETHKLSLEVALRSLKWTTQTGDKVTLKFNLMDYQGKGSFSTKFSMQKKDDQGQYGIIVADNKVEYLKTLKEESQKQPKKSSAQVGNQQNTQLMMNDQSKIIASKDKDHKVNTYQYARFTFSLYRYPFTSLLMISGPILLLAVLNLGLFMSQNSLGSRIATIATLLVAYAAFIPTIRSRVPPTPNLGMSDMMLYSLMLTSLLCFIRSYIDSSFPPTVLDHYDCNSEGQCLYNWRKDGFFMVSLAIVILWAFLTVILIIVHKSIWEPSYRKETEEQCFKNQEKFKSQKWSNLDCDRDFEPLRQQNRIRILGQEDDAARDFKRKNSAYLSL